MKVLFFVKNVVIWVNSLFVYKVFNNFVVGFGKLIMIILYKDEGEFRNFFVLYMCMFIWLLKKVFLFKDIIFGILCVILIIVLFKLIRFICSIVLYFKIFCKVRLLLLFNMRICFGLIIFVIIGCISVLW